MKKKKLDDVLDEEHIGFLVHDVARAFTSGYAELVKPLGLTRSQSRVIAYVARYPGITQTDLASFLSVATMSMSGILDRMEGKKLIKRGTDPTDRRVRRVYLTSAAKDLLDDIHKVVDVLTVSATQSISPTESARLAKMLHTIEDNLLKLLDDLKSSS